MIINENKAEILEVKLLFGFMSLYFLGLHDNLLTNVNYVFEFSKKNERYLYPFNHFF